MPQGTAAARADVAARNLNPSNSVAGGQVVTLELIFDTGKTFVPEDLWDALITKYGAGKVTGDTDTSGGNRFRWRVSP
jgi:hypothetical protein